MVDLLDDGLSEGVEQEMLSMVHMLSVGGTFFSTKRGWIGHGPSVVVRVKGLLRTRMLRLVEGTDGYLLVGPCYIQDDIWLEGWNWVSII